jgi:hypothetical protein
MAKVQVGQRVSVDMSGFQGTGVVVSDGITLSGKVLSIDKSSRNITIQLTEPFMGRPTVTVNPERVTVV